jgi:hypothetical protein
MLAGQIAGIHLLLNHQGVNPLGAFAADLLGEAIAHAHARALL